MLASENKKRIEGGYPSPHYQIYSSMYKKAVTRKAGKLKPL